MQEVEVYQVVLNEVMRDARDKRRVGAGVDRQPRFGVAHGGIAHAGVDDVDLRVGLLAQMSPIVMRDRAALARFHRARAEQQDELGVFGGGKGRSARLLAAVHIRRDARNLRGGIAVVEAQVAAHQVEHAVERTRGGSRNARGVRHIHGLVAVGVDDLFELGCSRVDGLFPADLLELALAALAHTLHGIAQWASQRR